MNIPRKALILAAGYGSRLAPLTDTIPKSLVPVNGKPILFKQIENLYENDIFDITVISGYKAGVLSGALKESFPEIKLLESEDYASTNNMYSAWLARFAFKDAPFIMMNADVFFDSSVIKALIEFPHENAIVTDVGRYLEESMKVVERDGRLVHISKTVSPEDALGSSIDVYKFSPEGGAAFFEKCSGYIEEKHQLKLWSEVALNDVLEDGLVPFFPCPLDGRWFEIDNHEDLAFANELFSVN